MSHQSLGFEPVPDPPQHVLPSQHAKTLAGVPSEWIPPPASLGSVNSDAIDFNDEVFFNYNHSPPYTAATDPYSPTEPLPVSSSTSSLTTAIPVLKPNPSASESTLVSPDVSLVTPETLVSPDVLGVPLVSRLKLDQNTHYSHRRFSSAAEQLDRMTLTASKSPSPVLKSTQSYSHGTEERTINPRQLLGNGDMALGAPKSQTARYILPSSVSSPSLSTAFFKVGANPVDTSLELASPAQSSADGRDKSPGLSNSINQYVMNDECLSAITYWLNNTADVISEKPDRSVIKNPTGIMKPAWNRRNSIQVVPQRDDMPRVSAFQQKRRRRKSDNLGIELPELRGPEPVVESPIIENVPAPAQPEEKTDMETDPPYDLVEQFELRPELERDRLSFDRKTGDDDEPKPFPCPECDKQFKRSEHLKRHIRSVHSNIRPFHCKYCDKKFSRSDNLAQHSKTHFKVNANGTTSIIYGNPNPHNRGGRKRSA